MKKLLIIALLSLTASCGFNGEQKVTTNDSEQRVVQDGESFTYIIVRLEFISQLVDLCNDLILDSDFETVEEADQARAQCVFDKIEDINVTLPEFQNDVNDLCEQPPETLAPEQLADFEALCLAI